MKRIRAGLTIFANPTKCKKNVRSNYISIKGAKVNNLKNIDVDIPRNKLVVITGLSGSGKSSLAFDTLYAEGSVAMWKAIILRPPVFGQNEQTGM